MGPLKGIKILDFTQAHAGSLATMLLADFGAEAIKIERAGVGDLARYWEPLKNGESGYFAFLNRNKKSISLDAFSREGKEIIFKLVKEVDVVCENFKYGSMDRLGFDYETLKGINPGIIYASLNGFGQSGVMKNVIGLDLQLQAMSGIMEATGLAQGPPARVGAALGDHISGTYMAMAVCLALIHRQKTGMGQYIDIAILDSLCSILAEHPAVYSLEGKAAEKERGRAAAPSLKVNSVSGAMANEQILSRDMVYSFADGELGEIKFPGIPIKLSGTAGKIRSGAPRKGEHTKYYLKSLKYEDEEIDELIAKGVVESSLENSLESSKEGERV